MDKTRVIALAMASGWWSGLLSAAALMLASRLSGDGVPTGLNGPSHWFFGERAAHAQRFSIRHTVVGTMTHPASSFCGASICAPRRPRRSALDHGDARIAAAAAAVTAVAAAVDLLVAPRRLTPGFERRLTAWPLAGVYVAFAVGLAAAALRERRHDLMARACSSPHSPHPPASPRCPAPRR